MNDEWMRKLRCRQKNNEFWCDSCLAVQRNTLTH